MAITYEQRYKDLKKTKIEHTLAKKEQSVTGSMDADDYGTIPRPEGYSFTPVYDRGEDFIAGAKGNAVNFKAFLENHPVYIDRLEILAGRWCDMLTNYRKQREAFEAYFPFEELKPGQQLYNIVSGIAADSHFACDYAIGLEAGFGGLLEKIRVSMVKNPDKTEFLKAEEMVVLAMQDFIKRHIIKAESMLEEEEDENIRETLSDMIKANKAIVSDKPSTLLEACQWVAWFNTISRMYDRDGAGFNLDVLLYPYYAKDKEAGLIDDEKAMFILADLLLNETHYYQLSGADENDNDMTNPLSFLILEAAHKLNISVNLTVRIHDKIDPAFLRKAVYYLFTDRNGWPRFSGDKGLMNFMKNDGVTKKEARNRIAVGCNWMALPGLEYPMNDCVKINAAKVMEVALNDMRASGVYATSDLYDRFIGHMKKAVTITASGINHHLDHQRDILPELVMNLMMVDTLEKGEDITQCARFHTIGCDGVALGTVSDSFAAMEQRIENEKILSWDDLFTALDANFEGVQNQRIRMMLQSSEKYCQGNSLGDKWAKRISQNYAQIIHDEPMPEGRQMVPGWFSWSNTITFGQAVGATPDGRLAGTPITHGANPAPGFRSDGASTAMATGVAAIQTSYGNTCPLQLEMDPKLSSDEGGLESVERLLRAHVDLGGTLININILDRDTIMEAHKNPLAHPSLVVRVTGFTAYFATLSPEFRQLVVDRFVEGF